MFKAFKLSLPSVGRVRRTGLAFLFSALLLCMCSVHAAGERVADLQPTGYVNDFAGVLSQATRDQLNSLCTQMDQQAHAQIAVVTLHTTGDDNIDDFAVKLEDKWKVGAKGSDRGLLLILATDDHHYRFEVGYGLESILPDAKVGDIGRSMVPYLRQNDYNSAVSLGVQSVSQVIAADAHVTLSGISPEAMQTQQHQPLRLVHDLFLAAGALIFFLWLMRSGPTGLPGFLLGAILGNILGGGGGGRGGDGEGGGGFGGFGGGGSGGGGASGGW